MIDKVTIPVTTAGDDGSASGSSRSHHVQGEIHAIHLDYDSQPATTDVIVSAADGPAMTLLSVANASDDGWFFPRLASVHHSSNGGTHAAVGDGKYPIAGAIGVSVAQGDAVTEGVKATIYLTR